MKLIILAAGMGTRLSPLTDSKPKALVKVKGQPLIDYTIQTAKSLGISDVVVLTGYYSDSFESYDVTLVHNERYSNTNMVESLFCAEPLFGDDFIVVYGDIFVNPEILTELLNYQGDCGVVVDLDWQAYWNNRFDDPLTDAESLKLSDSGHLSDIGKSVDDIKEIEAQYIGLMRFRGNGIKELKSAYYEAKKQSEKGKNCFQTDRSLAQIYLTDLLQGMIDRGSVIEPVFIKGGWLEIDDLTDHTIAERSIRSGKVIDSIRNGEPK